MSVSLRPRQIEAVNSPNKAQPKMRRKVSQNIIVCLQPGHFRAECPTSSDWEKLTWYKPCRLKISTLLVPTAEDKRKVYQKAGSKPVIIPGTVDEQLVPRVLLDTGAQQTIVNSQWVTPNKLLAETVHTEDHAHGVHEFQLAEVEIQVCGWSAVIKAAVQLDLSYDVLLGLDFPYTWEAAFQELDKAAVLLVRTRQQALADEKEKARKKSQEASEVALTLTNIVCDSPEDDTEECSGGPDSPTEEEELQRLEWIAILILRGRRRPAHRSGRTVAAVCTNLAGMATLTRVC